MARADKQAPAINSQHITPSGARYAGIDLESMTDAEQFAIRALRDWTRAQQDEDYRHDMDAWEEMRTYIELVNEGKWTLEYARSIMRDVSALPYYLMVKEAAQIHKWFACSFQNTNNPSAVAESDAEFDAWMVIYFETLGLLQGQEVAQVDRDDDPELYAICDQINTWVGKRRDRAVAGIKQKGGNAAE